MLILLPPSEGKAAPRSRGTATDVDHLSFPGLAETRIAIRDALMKVSAHQDSLSILGVGASLRTEVQRNTQLDRLPAARALEVYNGVLYAALGSGTLSAAAKRRASRSLVVQSALYGPVGPADKIAPYRLSMSAALPGLGPLARMWRSVLGPVLTEAAGTGVVIDCRSSTYAAAWQPSGALARRTVAIRVFSERNGQRLVVSHLAKHTRGLVARWLLEAPTGARSVEAVFATVAERAACELVDLGAEGFALDLIEKT